jgi:NAD(P) transhydrogenase subunit alpha
VIVDLAVETGGNVAGSVKDQVITTDNGVIILGHSNVPARLPRDASALFAKNVLNFVTLMVEKGTGALKINFDDELVKGTLITKDGAVIHPALIS